MIDMCNAFGPNCSIDWNAVSALATVGATATALFLPWLQRKTDQHERKRALGYALFLKLAKISSDLYKLHQHTISQAANAEAHDASPGDWTFFQPLATLPAEVSFSTDELALLFSLKEDDTFGAIISMDEMHRSTISLMRLYADKREALVQLFPGASMDGLVGSTPNEAALMRRVAPFAAQLNKLLSDIIAAIRMYDATALAALQALQQTLNAKLSLGMGLELPGRNPDGTPKL